MVQIRPDIRPKRKDHQELAKGTRWIKQIEYDCVCRYLDTLDDVHLETYISRIELKPFITDEKDRKRGITHYWGVPIPMYVDGGAVRWIAKAALKERKARRKKTRKGSA